MEDEKIIYNDEDIIGYEPNLEYNKDIEPQLDENGNPVNYSNSDSYTEDGYTPSLESITNNTPSKTLSVIDYVLDNIKFLTDELAKAFNKNDWNKYGDISVLISAIENNNTEYINEFIQAHKESLDGSIVPELLGIIYSEKERLEILNNTLKNLYYGDENITTEEAIEIDEGYIEKLKTYEKSKEEYKINYMTISYDSMLNKSSAMFAYEVNEKSMNISDIVKENDGSVGEEQQRDIITKLFNDLNVSIDNRMKRYEQQQNVEIMQKTLYNYYETRKDLNDLYDLKMLSPDSVFVKQKIVDYQDKMNESLKNIYKTYSGNREYLSQMCELETEKSHLLNIYSTFNNKS